MPREHRPPGTVKMSKYLDLGIGICIINIYYSLSYFLMWCVELRHDHAPARDTEPIVWLAVYTFNLLLNVFLFVGLRKRDRRAVILWCSLTLLWFLPKLYEHKRGSLLARRGSTYEVVNIFMETYVIISFVVMALVYIYLPKKATKPRQPERSVEAKNGNPLDIQMVDLLSRGANGNSAVEDDAVRQRQSTGDQLVSSFDFHRAND